MSEAGLPALPRETVAPDAAGSALRRKSVV